MKLCDIAVKDAIIADLQAGSRDDAINMLVDSLIGAGVLDAARREDVIASILDRERKGSTGFGKGVAIPHVKADDLNTMVAAVGVSENGIDFNALDKQPVYTVFLLVSPAADPEQHLRAMEIIFKNLSQDSFRRFLRQANSVDEVWTVLKDSDEQRLPLLIAAEHARPNPLPPTVSEQASIRVTIVNRLGLHARPAMAFVDLASTFDADINVHRVDDPSPEPLDGKSIMHVMMLAATQHSELQIDASGPGAEGACAALAKLVKSGFGEH